MLIFKWLCLNVIISGTMRRQLQKINDVRASFSGTYVRSGIKKGWKGRLEATVLLKDVKDMNGKIVTDHLWFNMTMGFASLTLKEGDIVQFDARVKPYQKFDREYGIREIDYKLSHPTKVRKMVLEQVS